LAIRKYGNLCPEIISRFIAPLPFLELGVTMTARALRIFSKLSEPVDAILLVNEEEPIADVSYFYATGVTSGLMEHCPVVLWPDGRMQLISSRLEETTARTSKAEVLTYANVAERAELVKEVLRGVKRLGINGPGITYHWVKEVEKVVPKVTLVDVEEAVTKARMVKDADEIVAIKDACAIASKVGDQIPDFVHLGMTETEAAAEIGYRMQKLGASSVSFETISAFGPSAAEPHYSPADRKLKKGDPALFDYGCKVRRYCSDITRTFFAGSVDKKFERVYEVVLEAQRRAIAEVRAGVKAATVDGAARFYIDSTEFKGALIHSTGHGLGLAVHDGGRLVQGTDLVLEENMIFTVEPGVYIPGVGGVRIEDDVRVTKTGCEVLTTSKKELTVIQ
jgi:Xaa-Pro dipeptidase